MQKKSGAATRKLKQAIGRGIRSEGDKASIHILDPRFPKGNSVKKTMYDYLKSAIPLRFKADYANAISIRESQDTGEKKTLTFV